MLTVAQLVKILSAFYETRRFTTALKTAPPPPIPLLSHISLIHDPTPCFFKIRLYSSVTAETVLSHVQQRRTQLE
jgi:hypothetical protein